MVQIRVFKRLVGGDGGQFIGCHAHLFRRARLDFKHHFEDTGQVAGHFLQRDETVPVVVVQGKGGLGFVVPGTPAQDGKTTGQFTEIDGPAAVDVKNMKQTMDQQVGLVVIFFGVVPTVAFNDGAWHNNQRRVGEIERHVQNRSKTTKINKSIHPRLLFQ